MGLFSLRPDYISDGPGVSKNAPKKHGFFLFFEILFRKFFKLINLNFIYFLSLFTIIGIGPATAGMTYVLRNFSREEHAFVWLDFKDAAFKNFKQSFIVTLINFIGLAVLICSDFYYGSVYLNIENPSIFHLLPFAVSMFATVIFFFMQFYLYIMIVTFDLSLKQLYKNALIFAFYGFPRNLLITLGIALCSLFIIDIRGTQIAIGEGLVPVFVSSLGILLLITIFFSLTAYIAVFNAYQIIDKIMIKPYEKEEAAKKKNQTEKIFSDERIDVKIDNSYMLDIPKEGSEKND